MTVRLPSPHLILTKIRHGLEFVYLIAVLLTKSSMIAGTTNYRPKNCSMSNERERRMYDTYIGISTIGSEQLTVKEQTTMSSTQGTPFLHTQVTTFEKNG